MSCCCFLFNSPRQQADVRNSDSSLFRPKEQKRTHPRALWNLSRLSGFLPNPKRQARPSRTSPDPPPPGETGERILSRQVSHAHALSRLPANFALRTMETPSSPKTCLAKLRAGTSGQLFTSLDGLLELLAAEGITVGRRRFVEALPWFCKGRHRLASCCHTVSTGICPTNS